MTKKETGPLQASPSTRPSETSICKPKTQRRPRWIMGVRDLPFQTEPDTYLLRDQAGQERTLKLSKRKRQVVDALAVGPLFCASTVRIGDVVFRLKREDHVNIKTGTTATGRKFYELASEIRRRRDVEVV